MNKKAVCVFGVNGVGKSSLLRLVSEEMSDTVVYRGSALLKESLSIASYEGLEAMNSARKKRCLIESMESVVSTRSCGVVFVDTHLVVPLRKNGALLIEDMWDEKLLDIFDGFVCVIASPDMVSCRRKVDGERTIRSANSSVSICAEDLRLTAEKWDGISSSMKKKRVIVNDQSIRVGAGKIAEFIVSIAH